MNKEDIKKLMTILLSINVTLASCLPATVVKAETNTNDTTIATYQDFFDDEVEYKNDSYYLSDEQINNLVAFNKMKPNYTYNFDGNVTNVIESIVRNSLVETAEDKDYVSVFQTKYKDDIIKELTNILTDLSKNGTNDLKSDFYTLSKLKVITYRNVNANGFNQYYNDSNTMIMNVNSIKSNEDLKYLLNYMVNSVRANERIISNDLTLNYEKNVNTLLYDAAIDSEIDINKELKVKNNAFDTAKECAGELLLLNIVNQDKKAVNNYYNAIFDSDLNGLFNVLNLKDQEDIEHFYKILYTMDAKLYRNSYIEKYMNKNVYEEPEQYYNFVGYDYKIDLYKRSVNNLFEYQKANKDVSISEILVLYNMITNAVINDVSDQKTIKDIQELDNKFIEYLSYYYKLSVDDVKLIEDYTVRYILIDMAALAHNDEKMIEQYKNDAEKILEKYPLTKIIAASNYIYETQKGKAYDSIKLTR